MDTRQHNQDSPEGSRLIDEVVVEAVQAGWTNTEIARQLLCTPGNNLPRYRRAKARIAKEVDKSNTAEDSEL